MTQELSFLLGAGGGGARNLQQSAEPHSGSLLLKLGRHGAVGHTMLGRGWQARVGLPYHNEDEEEDCK